MWSPAAFSAVLVGRESFSSFPCKATSFFSFPKKNQAALCVWQWPCECCGFSVLQMSGSAVLSHSAAEQQHHLHRVQACINPYRCVVFPITQLVWRGLCDGVPSVASLLLGTDRKGSSSYSSLRRILPTCCPIYSWDCTSPGWMCKPLFETLWVVHHGQFSFSLPNVWGWLVGDPHWYCALLLLGWICPLITQ